MSTVMRGGVLFAHFSDILRNSLLAKYGGLWLDSTCWTTQKISEIFAQLPFFSVSDMNTGTKYVSYAMGSGVIGNITSSFVKDILMETAKGVWPDYLFQDALIKYAYTHFDASKDSLNRIPQNNTRRMELFSNMNKPFNQKWYNELIQDNWIFKLSYKAYYQTFVDGKPTFYKKLFIDRENSTVD